MAGNRIEFELNEAKMQNMGGGSITSFCERFNINRNLMYHIKGKSYVRPNTKSASLVEKLITMGVGKYINSEIEEESNSEKEQHE